jgi:DNA-binding PadR family transcriptional regulator
MFRHLVLGLLRDGEPRHGYELTTEYKGRTGVSISTGNFYRELQRLAADGLIETRVNPPEADGRRIPYQITDWGRKEFDQWLVGPSSSDTELCERLLFIDRVPRDVLARIMEWWQDELWMRSKALARAREEALRQAQADTRRFNPLPVLLARRMKVIAAELEFIKEVRTEFDAWVQRQAAHEEAGAAPTGPKRSKGSVRK